MLLVIDSNEYILAFGPGKEISSKSLLDLLLETATRHSLRIPRLTVEEVRRYLSPEDFREFIGFIAALTNMMKTSLCLKLKYPSQTGPYPPRPRVSAW